MQIRSKSMRQEWNCSCFWRINYACTNLHHWGRQWQSRGEISLIPTYQPSANCWFCEEAKHYKPKCIVSLFLGKFQKVFFASFRVYSVKAFLRKLNVKGEDKQRMCIHKNCYVFWLISKQLNQLGSLKT